MDCIIDVIIASTVFLLTSIFSVCLVLWQINKTRSDGYISTIKIIRAEMMENLRVTIDGERFVYGIDGEKYELLLTFYGDVSLEGALSSERLSNSHDEILVGELVLLLRKMKLYNSLTVILQEKVGDVEASPIYMKWLIKNLSNIESKLLVDFRVVIDVLDRELKTRQRGAFFNMVKNSSAKCITFLKKGILG